MMDVMTAETAPTNRDAVRTLNLVGRRSGISGVFYPGGGGGECGNYKI